MGSLSNILLSDKLGLGKVGDILDYKGLVLRILYICFASQLLVIGLFLASLLSQKLILDDRGDSSSSWICLGVSGDSLSSHLYCTIH